MNYRGGGAPENSFLKGKTRGFTLAEVLITIGIIGLVAAMTMPMLIANHRKQVMLTKVKRTYNVLNNALERAKVDYGTDVNGWYLPKSGSQLEKSMFFVETYMLPYLNTVYYCKNKFEVSYCTEKKYNIRGDDWAYIGPVSEDFGTSFVLNDGVYVYVTVGEFAYTPSAGGYDETINRVVIQFDIDNYKGYNKLGYDIFMLELGGAEGLSKRNDADKNKFLPYGHNSSKSCDYYVSNINHACNPEVTYPGSYCLAYIVCNGWSFGDKYPW